MAKRKQKYTPKAFESGEPKKPISANIYLDMMLSDAWQDLTDSARVIYLYMKSQYYGQKNVSETDFMGEKTEYEQECFYFNRGLLKKFGKTDPTTCKKAIDKLISHGFIEVAYNGKQNTTKSIYRFSAKWQVWEPTAEEKQKKAEKKTMLRKNLESKNK